MRVGQTLAELLGPIVILLVNTVVASALGEDARVHGQLEPGTPANDRVHVIRKEVDSLGFVHDQLVPTSLSEVREVSLGGSFSPSPGMDLDPYNVPAPIIGPPGRRGSPGSKGTPGKPGAVGSKGKKGEKGGSSDTEVAKALEQKEPMASMLALVSLVIANFVLVGACHFFASSQLIKPMGQEGTDAGTTEDYVDDADAEGEKDMDGEEYGDAEEHETEGSPQT